MIMLTISDRTIGIIDGLYCLNDLHQASGGQKKHQPFNFMRNKEVVDLINKLQCSSDMRNKQVFTKLVSGKNRGTYVCKELVYRYAMWISAEFTLLVIRTFDEVANQYQKLDKRLDGLCRDLNTVTTNLSSAGRFLNIGGKQIKPQLEQLIDSTLKEMQPSLNLEAVIDND